MKSHDRRSYDCFSKKTVPFGFWANAEVFEVTNIKAYNRAVGCLFIGFGIIFILLGLPLLLGQNSGWIVITILGAMVESVLTMAVYVTVIEKKYRAKK